jgi:nucleoside-diphosphate-sugar epimerase
MRVLLIGGSGFIGRFVTAALARDGHELAILHRGRAVVPPHCSIVGDRRQLAASRDAIAGFRPDVVVDLVLASERQAREVAAVLRGIARRLIVVSSMDVYRACGVLHGSEPGPLEPLPLTEASPLRTQLQPYPPQQVERLQQVFGWLESGYDKILVERALLGAPDLDATVLRLPIVYGPGDPLRRFQPLVRRIDDGRPAIIVPGATWRATRGYVEDVAAAIARAATAPGSSRVYNVGDPDALTEFEWAQLVAHAAGWNGELVALDDDRVPAHLRLDGNTAQHWVADTSLVRRELRLGDPVPRAEAIRRTIAWERATPVTSGTQQSDYAAEDAALAGR